MMLRRKDHLPHPSSPQRGNNRIRIELRRVEHRRILVAIAPFLIGERIHREVQKRIQLQLMPLDLPLGRHCSIRGRLPRSRSNMQLLMVNKSCYWTPRWMRFDLSISFNVNNVLPHYERNLNG